MGLLGRMTTSGVVSNFSSPNPYPDSVATGSDGALWYTFDSQVPCTSGCTENLIGRTQPPLASNRAGVLPHIAAGGPWSTVITLCQPTATAAQVTVAFHNDDGSALSLPVTTTSQGTTASTASNSVTATINPNATLLISTGQMASTVVGWADVSSPAAVGGLAIFRTASSNSPVSEGTVALQSHSASTITLPYDNTSGFVMGVALANLSASSANITATIWDDSGNQLGTQTIALAGSGHTAFVLPTQIALTAGKRGIVQFQSTGGIAGLGLRFSSFGTFTSVPSM